MYLSRCGECVRDWVVYKGAKTCDEEFIVTERLKTSSLFSWKGSQN